LKANTRLLIGASKLEISKENLIILYAGIIGHAQGLEVIIKAAEKVRSFAVSFIIVGDGQRKTSY
jgi:colanic acid biosynthesis glycosyl transferase WcaI